MTTRPAKPKKAAMVKPALKAARKLAKAAPLEGGPPEPGTVSKKAHPRKAAILAAKHHVEGVRPAAKAARDVADAKRRQAALVGRSQLNMKG